MALSSSVRSIHWVAAVLSVLAGRDMRNLAMEQQRSERIGLRLYAMADDPICVFSNGSSSSFMLASSRMSVHSCRVS